MAPRASRASTENKEKAEHQGPAPDPTQALAAAIEIYNEDFKALNIHGKIAAISGFLGRIPKNGWNKYNSYAYVLESDLVEAVRWYLAACRILIYQSVKEHTIFPFDGVMVGGRQRDILTDVVYTFVVTDGATGESFSFDMLGQGMDPRDKGSNKASTSAMKFAYLRLFNVASGEDAERDEQGDAAADTGTPPPVSITSNNVAGVERGGRQELATGAQIKAVSALSNELQLGGPGLGAIIEKILPIKLDLPEAEAEHGKYLATILKSMKGEEIGKLIYTLQETAKAAQHDAGMPGYGD